MKIIIIGSQGFIGSHAFDYFSVNNEVLGADVIDNVDQENYIQLDKQTTDYNPIFEKNQFDVCINASGNGSVPISINLPVFDFELNTFNTIKVLEAIKIHNPNCKFINLSSAAIYGNPLKLPINETDQARPLSPYGWHKLYSEQICKEYFYLYNIKTINLRLFSVYGEGLRKQLFWDIYKKCLRNNKIELFGTGAETRDFIYIKDLIVVLKFIIEDGLFNGESVNVASGIETTIKEAATIFCKEIDPEISITFNNLVKPGDPHNWRADVSLLNSFGCQTTTEINVGLKNLVEWLKESKLH
ncbi:NAD-dependent epimerase/dehydratase family protein [Mucilaginibacter sp.]|uniref:NAD-dependent epimerase/dehydratase family protein n=1 Tax=Mucilaginibacter sp. TaxID=1882438 RepID=UPI003AFFB130